MGFATTYDIEDLKVQSTGINKYLNVVKNIILSTENKTIQQAGLVHEHEVLINEKCMYLFTSLENTTPLWKP